MSEKEELLQLKSIKNNLLKLECPHIDITEDDIQIKSLLLENSNYRQELIKWLLETLIDSVEFDIDETLQTLGLNLKTLPNWELALKLVEGKQIHSDSGLDGLRQARNYFDFLIKSNLATPLLPISNVKSNLIQRDIEKDVSSRCHKDDDINTLSIQIEDLKNIRNSLGEEKSSFEAFITADIYEPSDHNKTANYKIDQVLEVMKQYRKDYEQDFKPWTDRSEAPETNDTLEKLIENMHGNVLQINQNLENNSKLRQSTIAITEVLKNI